MQVYCTVRLITVQIQGDCHHRDLQHNDGGDDVAPETEIEQTVQVVHSLLSLSRCGALMTATITNTARPDKTILYAPLRNSNQWQKSRNQNVPCPEPKYQCLTTYKLKLTGPELRPDA
jgi:hypothetical protein